VSLGCRKPPIFMRPVKSSQRRYQTSSLDSVLDKGKTDI